VLVILKKDNKTKKVQLSNYYHPDIGLAIGLINDLTPKNYKIWYDKERLLKGQNDCDEGRKK